MTLHYMGEYWINHAKVVSGSLLINAIVIYEVVIILSIYLCPHLLHKFSGLRGWRCLCSVVWVCVSVCVKERESITHNSVMITVWNEQPAVIYINCQFTRELQRWCQQARIIILLQTQRNWYTTQDIPSTIK